jgi:pilus assembly protein CpaB
MGRRTLLLTASLLVAALGTALVWLYVLGADRRAESRYDYVKVWVALQDIPSGTDNATLRTKVEQRDFFVGSKPDGAVTKLDDVRGQVVRGTIHKGEPLVAAQFGATTDTPDLIGQDPKKMAISVQLADPNRVAGFLRAGSHVAVFLVDPDYAKTGEGQHRAKVILAAVKVLTTGSTQTVPQPTKTDSATATTAEQVSTAIVTLEVDQDQATKLLLGQKSGELYFTLLGEKATASTGSFGDAKTVLGD